MIAIVIVDFNGLGDTLECLASIFAKKPVDVEVIVVDNGSQPPNDAAIREAYPDAVVMRSEENRGWSGGNNMGAFEAIRRGADWLFLLNNDVVLKEEWYSSIKDVVDSGKWDVFGPLILDYLPPHAIQTEGVNFNRKGRTFFDRVRVIETESCDTQSMTVKECDIVNGCALIVRARLFQELRGIDDRFFLIAEESDLCLRAKLVRARVGVLNKALVLHKHSVSFARAGRPLQLYYGTRNLGLLVWKHPTGEGRNRRLISWLSYFKSVYYSYSREIEYSNKPGATAVCEGFTDFIFGRFGRKPSTRLFVTTIVEKILNALMFIRRFL